MTSEALALISSAVVIVVGIGFYVWYGVALSRLFPRLGAEGWKGWVPVLNEMEILVRGGVPAWNIVFSFIPVVSLYGIYLKAIAVHRINESFGKGSGFTVLGIFLPPLWATLLAGARMPEPGDYDRRVEGLLSPAPLAPPAPPLYASAPPPPPPAPVPVSFPSMAASSEPPLFAEEPAFPQRPPVPQGPPSPPTAPPAPPQAPPAFRDPVVAPEPDQGTVFNPWAVPETAAPSPEPAPLAAPVVVPPAPAPADDEDELDKTVAVDRRPVVPWRLITDEGHVIPLRTRTVLLGRKPVAPSEAIAAVVVPDTTKTLSKNHARLELSDEGVWTVHDLDSTNGVIIVEADGTETLLPQGGSAPVPGRFLLGKVGMRVTFDDTEATR